jgi:hypothetical protein
MAPDVAVAATGHSAHENQESHPTAEARSS